MGRFYVWLGLLGVFALGSTPAMAARGHEFTASFGEACVGAPPCGSGQFDTPSGVAVNEGSHQVYVADRGDGRVEYFSAGDAFVGQFDGSGLLAGEGSGAPSGKFSGPEGIAVDNACIRHHPELTEVTVPTCASFDPSNGDVYVVDAGHAVVDKFTASGEYVGQLTHGAGVGFGEVDGVAVTSTGKVWVYEGSGNLDEFDSQSPENEFKGAVASEATGIPFPGIAVDSTGAFYVVNAIARVLTRLDGAGHVTAKEVDGEETTAVALEAGSDDVLVGKAGSVGVFAPSLEAIERLGQGHLTATAGIAVDARSETIYATDGASNVVDVFGPEPPRAPTVDSTSVSEVSGESATLESEVNPRGASTTYRFEYGECASVAACDAAPFGSKVPVPDGLLASSFDSQRVSEHVKGLSAGAVYHVRVVAQNEHGTDVGEERVFVMQGGAGAGLLDGRGWELVSPTDKQGALIEGIGQRHVTQAAADGSSVTYATAAPTEKVPQGNSNLSQVVSARTSTGWTSRDVSLPHSGPTGLSLQGQEYRLFSADLAKAVVQPFDAFVAAGPATLAPETASEQTAFLRQVSGATGSGSWCASSCYEPLVTGAAGVANVPGGTVFGAQCRGILCGPQFVGASRDLSHVVVQSDVALTEAPLSVGGLYEWAHGKIVLVSALPNGAGPAGNDPRLGTLDASTRGAISSDGSRVVWAEHLGEKHLYLSDTVRGETVQLDVVQPGASGENPSEPAFQFASSDGSRVFFTDRQLLTPDSGGGATRPVQEDDMYVCDIVIEEEKLTCRLTDLTPLHEGLPAHVLDDALGASEDGSYIYFVANGRLPEANGQLPKGAVEGDCSGTTVPSIARCNLYVAHLSGGVWATQLITVLSMEDAPDWNGEANAGYLEKMPVRVSPNGQWLEFMSDRGLTRYGTTPYDTRDAVTGKRDEEVYLYGAGANTLVCASCNPSGARPQGAEYGTLHYGLDGVLVWRDERGLAASVPASPSFNFTESAYQSRYLNDSGRLFFNASDALVPSDVNGTGDVYEFEPAGVGNCHVGGQGYSDVSGGCVGLISSGTSSEESGFLDASESGDDVFFFTQEPLTAADRDTSLDVYDAHVCTGAAPCFPTPPQIPPACGSADGCRAAPSPQPGEFGLPGSATFSGKGNLMTGPGKPPTLSRAQKLSRALASCRKRFRKHARRRLCERQARKRYAPVRKSPAAGSHHGKKAGH